MFPFQHENSQSLLVIDEIGKMELFSELFKSRVGNIFSNQSQHVVLATIPIRKSDALIENIRNHSKGKVWTVSLTLLITHRKCIYLNFKINDNWPVSQAQKLLFAILSALPGNNVYSVP